MPRPRISYANVVSTLALVLALGGVSYAAVKISGKSIKDRSVGAAKIKKNSLTGTEINEAKLGKVPAAANADAVGGQSAQSFKLSCPQGTTAVIGECFETSLRAAASLSDAVKTCGAAGRRLPTFAELESARQNNVSVGAPSSNYEMSSTVGADSPNNVLDIDSAGNRFAQTYTDATHQFRCVQSPTN